MKLLLTSNGLSHPQIIREFLNSVNKPVAEIKVIFVPTASIKNKKYQKYEIGCLTNVGIKEQNIKTIVLDRKISYKDVSSFDVIYVIGGNSFYLLSKVKESGFDKIIKKFLNEGGVYFGVSAGSYIACPTIEAAGWKHADRNIVGLTNLSALDIVPFLISAHYNKKKYADALKEGISNTKYPVRILADGQAILVKDKEFKLIGSSKEIKV